MTRLLLITLLLLSSSPAYAEWVVVDKNDDGTTYIDPDTIRRKGNLVKMWHLFDYKTTRIVAGNLSLSSKAQSEYDCAEERFRGLAYTDFLFNMGRGMVTNSSLNEEKWQPVQPRSVGEALWEAACGKK